LKLRRRRFSKTLRALSATLIIFEVIAQEIAEELQEALEMINAVVQSLSKEEV